MCGGSIHVRTIVEALDENSTSSPDLSGVRSIKNDTSETSMKKLFRGVKGQGSRSEIEVITTRAVAILRG